MTSRSNSKEKILVFGGNGFMGAATVRHFLDQCYSVTIVNRGNWYWDAGEIIKPRVKHIVCDRYVDDLKSSCPQLVNYIAENAPFKAVVDFSSLSGKAMENSLELLYDKTELYVYISSDSVYEISERNYDGPSKEDGFKLPVDPVYLELLKESDDYAWGKIEGELCLRKYAERGLKYVALRLPDVIGPRDTFEDRWFQYFLWVRFSSELKKPVSLPSQFINAQMSMIYVEDLAKMVAKIVEMDPKTLDSEYNLGFRCRVTLLQVLQFMQQALGVDVSYTLDAKNECYLWLPSVKRGPIDIGKATSKLNWQTTSIPAAVKETVLFFDNAMAKATSDLAYKWHRIRVIERLKNGVFKGMEKELDQAIDTAYGPC